jgi:hypothetical protein
MGIRNFVDELKIIAKSVVFSRLSCLVLPADVSESTKNLIFAKSL